VRVLHASSGVIEGHLAAPVPDGPGGWIVLDVNGQLRAIPLAQVGQLWLL
jgi:hypothetical protein